MSSFGEVVPSFFLASCKDMTDFGDIIESGDYSLAKLLRHFKACNGSLLVLLFYRV